MALALETLLLGSGRPGRKWRCRQRSAPPGGPWTASIARATLIQPPRVRDDGDLFRRRLPPAHGEEEDDDEASSVSSDSWVDASDDDDDGDDDDVSNVSEFDFEADKETQSTSWLLTNVPEQYSRSSLIEVIKEEGFYHALDFLYLPVSVPDGLNFGHAFLNFATPEDGVAFRRHFRGFRRWTLQGKPLPGRQRAAVVTDVGIVQGLEANIERQRNNPIMHESVPDEFRPLLLRDGVRMPFPPPTKALVRPRGLRG